MDKRIQLLAVLLGVQVLLAVAMGIFNPSVTAPTKPGLLLVLNKGNIDHITLEGPDKQKLTLVHKDNQWLLPDQHDFPADKKLVTQLLDRLLKLKPETTVATSSSAQDRFKVNDDHFERRITLAQGNNILAKLYLGTTPGMHRVHARLAGKDDIQEIKLAAYDVPVKAAQWEDKTLLKLPKDDIVAIDDNGLKLQRKQGNSSADKNKGAEQWTASGLATDEQLKTGAANDLVQQLANIRFNHVLGDKAKSAYGLDKPLIDIQLTEKDGKTRRYELGKEKDSKDYALQASNRPELFNVAGWQAALLIKAAQRSNLIGSTGKPLAAKPASDSKPQPAS